MGGHAVMRVRGHDENEDELEKNGKAYHCSITQESRCQKWLNILLR